MAQDRRVVTVTTVHAAKGLEFDHVLLTEAHKTSRPILKDQGVALLGRPGGQALLGLRLDPRGGLTPCPDPLGIIARYADRAEARAEGLRLFYVGFTRAKRSVTFALKKKRADNLADTLRHAFHAASAQPENAGSIRLVSPQEIAVRTPSRPLRQRTGRVGEFVSSWAQQAGWALARPSGARETIDGDDVSSQVRFEWPLVGVEPEVIWAGRADLVLELGGSDVAILDFKAGAHAATAENIPGVREYAPQLDAYRRMLEAAGRRVVETGLVYVRGVSWVRAVVHA